ncbi:hypothetical protein AGLY_016451 [Aphis glycines]|uniref:TTF-type domain-containing protein n=1 Tax=Aphis glycines TaxID=307491 RepID=A0A6G0SZQ7_APHGL|nr:hypothetical protein AGLY_016451 [Aphis glycines]
MNKKTILDFFKKDSSSYSNNESTKVNVLQQHPECSTSVYSNEKSGSTNVKDVNIFQRNPECLELSVSTNEQPKKTAPHPDDPINALPSNRLEFQARITRGPFQPNFNIFPRTQCGNYSRSFHKKYYSEFKWLEYSPTTDSAFCFACRCFSSNNLNVGQKETAFTTEGFNTWKNISESLKKHQKSKSHFHSFTSLSNFLIKKPIDVILDETKEKALSKRQIERQGNRSVMHRHIDITILLAKTGKPFRGHKEREEDSNRGMFLELAYLFKKYDPTLKKHLEEGPQNATYMSNLIQNDLISSLHSVLKRQLVLSLKNKKISIMADETSDCGHHEQISVIVRFYDESLNKPVEYFVLNQLGLSWLDIIAVCFDGAMAGNINEASCIRHSILETVANQINLKLRTLKSISTTRWACRYEAVAAVKNNYTAIIIAIQTICDTTKQSEVRAKSRGLIFQLKTFDFIFALNILYPILLLIVKVNSCLQAEELNLLTSTNFIQFLKQKLYQLRSDTTFFNGIYCDTVKHCEENNVAIPKVRKRKISTKIDYSANNQYFADTKEEELRVSCSNVVLYDLLNGLNDRFNQETLNLILAVGNVLKLEPTIENLLCLESAFEVDCNDLNGEIQLLRNIPGVPLGSTTKTIFHWIEFLNQNNQKNIFLEFHKVIVLFSTIPVTSCSCERAFSKLTMVKLKLRSTMTQQRLDSLMFLFIEQQMTNNINYDDVIEEFKVMTPSKRRLEL